MTNTVSLQPGCLGLNLNFLTSWTFASECGSAKRFGSRPQPALSLLFHLLAPSCTGIDLNICVYPYPQGSSPVSHHHSSIYIPLTVSRCPLAIALACSVQNGGIMCPQEDGPKKEAWEDPESRPGHLSRESQGLGTQS